MLLTKYLVITYRVPSIVLENRYIVSFMVMGKRLDNDRLYVIIMIVVFVIRSIMLKVKRY